MKRTLIPIISALLALLLLCGCTGASVATPTSSPAPGVSASPHPSSSPTPDQPHPSTSPVPSSSAPSTAVPSAAVTPTAAPKSVSTPRPTPVHRHSYTAVVTSPSCTTKGYTTYTCACGYHYQDHVSSALGHTFGDWVTTVAPTAFSAGTQVRTCTFCGTQESATIPPAFEPSAITRQVVNLVNQERANAGLPPLTAVTNLDIYAQTRSTELPTVFDHVRPDGSNPLTAVFSLGNYSTAGENIAMGYASAQAVMEGWMKSPGHRENILSTKYSFIGVGCYNHNGVMCWTQIFAG